MLKFFFYYLSILTVATEPEMLHGSEPSLGCLV